MEDGELRFTFLPHIKVGEVLRKTNRQRAHVAHLKQHFHVLEWYPVAYQKYEHAQIEAVLMEGFV